MIKSLIQGLSEKDVQAVVKEYTLSSFYYPTLFPLRYSLSLKWEQLEGEFGAPIAGDVVAFDSRAPRKKRQVVSKLYGDIPKIAIARDKTESQMNEYNQLIRYADDSAKKRLVEWIWEDQQFVYDGVNARLEWLALRAASLGKVVLTTSTNDGVITESNVDFQIPAANKSGVAVNITVANAATSKPITKIRAIVKTAKAAGQKLNYIFTDQDMVDSILASAETISFVAPYVAQALNLSPTLSLQSLNVALRQQGLPQIGVIESYIQLEIKGTRTTVNPWEAGVMLFSETPTLGNTYYAPLADQSVESTTSIKVTRDHIMIKRFAQEEPLVESCLAMANAFPVLANASGKYLVDGLNSSWSK